jgi:DNA-binding PadR family transcriptional regulator
VLKDAGLVTDSHAGTRRLYQLDRKGIARLRAHFDQVWEQALSAFKGSVENKPQGDQNGKHRAGSDRT